MGDVDDIRAGQRAAWAGLASGWDRWDEIIQAQLAPVGEAMVAGLDLRPHQQHLDIASGTGEPGLSIAALVPGGRVVLTDLAEPMLEVAGRRAAARGIGNVELEVCSADDLPFADERFDSITVRFGLMFFPDLPAAVAELARVLRPGGRLAASVWVEPDRNPWTSLAMQVIATEVPVAPPAPGAPHMYRCGASGFVTDLFEGAGLVDIHEDDVEVDLDTASPDDWWAVMSEHVSIAVAALAQVDDAARERLRARAVEVVKPYARDGRIHVPGLARCTFATKRPA